MNAFSSWFARFAWTLLVLISKGSWLWGQELPTNEEAVATLLKQTGTDPIVIPESSRTHADYQRESEKWVGRFAIEPAVKASRKEAYGDRLSLFAEKVWPLLSSGQISAEGAETLRAEGEILRREGIKDPLLAYLYAHLRRHAGNSADIQDFFYSAVRYMQPKLEVRDLAMFDLVAIFELGIQSGIVTEALRPRLVRRLEEALVDNVFEAHPAVAMQYFVGALDLLPGDFDHIMAIVEKSNLPEWARRTILGQGEIKLAWQSRGGDYAQNVTKDGWAGFHHHLKRAREHLTAAWRLNPHDPMAATLMISVVMGEGLKNGESLRLWFDRAIAACCDFRPAYSAFELAIAPRWHGSLAHQLAFAFACADVPRAETSIPDRFVAKLDSFDDELEDSRDLYRQPIIAERLARIYKSKIESPQNVVHTRTYLAKLAVYAWLSENWTAARESALRLNGVWSRILDPYVKEYECTRLRFVFECVTGGTWMASFEKAARKASEDGRFAEAQCLTASLLPLVPVMATPHLYESLRINSFQQTLNRGEWLTLTGDNHGVGWIPIEGEIYSSRKQTALFRGGAARFRCLFQPRLGSDFEMRGKVRLKHTSTKFASFGVLFERNPLGAGKRKRTALTMEVILSSPTSGIVSLIYRGRAVSKRVPIEAAEQNEFHFKKLGNQVTLTWNGTSVLAEVPKEYPVQADPMMGLGWMPQGGGTETEISGLEVRRVGQEL